jgi:hypothetical protein
VFSSPLPTLSARPSAAAGIFLSAHCHFATKIKDVSEICMSIQVILLKREFSHRMKSSLRADDALLAFSQAAIRSSQLLLLAKDVVGIVAPLWPLRPVIGDILREAESSVWSTIGRRAAARTALGWSNPALLAKLTGRGLHIADDFS